MPHVHRVFVSICLVFLCCMTGLMMDARHAACQKKPGAVNTSLEEVQQGNEQQKNEYTRVELFNEINEQYAGLNDAMLKSVSRPLSVQIQQATKYWDANFVLEVGKRKFSRTKAIKILKNRLIQYPPTGGSYELKDHPTDFDGVFNVTVTHEDDYRTQNGETHQHISQQNDDWVKSGLGWKLRRSSILYISLNPSFDIQVFSQADLKKALLSVYNAYNKAMVSKDFTVIANQLDDDFYIGSEDNVDRDTNQPRDKTTKAEFLAILKEQLPRMAHGERRTAIEIGPGIHSKYDEQPRFYTIEMLVGGLFAHLWRFDDGGSSKSRTVDEFRWNNRGHQWKLYRSLRVSNRSL